MTNNLAYYTPDTDVALTRARVLVDHDDHFSVATGQGTLTARRAASCLLRPAPGDLVLMSRDSGTAYILAILERNASETDLDLPGNVRVNTADGSLTLAAAGPVEIASATAVGLTAPRLQADAAHGDVRIDGLAFTGRTVDAVCHTLSVAARSIDQSARRLVQRLGCAFRYVSEHDEVQAASARQIVDGTLTIQTENTVHLAEQHIKIDAEQVHLG